MHLVARVYPDRILRGELLLYDIAVGHGDGTHLRAQVILSLLIAPDVPVDGLRRAVIQRSQFDERTLHAVRHLRKGQSFRKIQFRGHLLQRVCIGTVIHDQGHLVHLLQPVGLAIDHQDETLRDRVYLHDDL